jgi:hypothetical protein
LAKQSARRGAVQEAGQRETDADLQPRAFSAGPKDDGIQDAVVRAGIRDEQDGMSRMPPVRVPQLPTMTVCARVEWRRPPSRR